VSAPEADPAPSPSRVIKESASPQSVTIKESATIDPEDWASSDNSFDEERHLKERPPHWQ
jgi:hypothetical protein